MPRHRLYAITASPDVTEVKSILSANWTSKTEHGMQKELITNGKGLKTGGRLQRPQELGWISKVSNDPSFSNNSSAVLITLTGGFRFECYAVWFKSSLDVPLKDDTPVTRTLSGWFCPCEHSWAIILLNERSQVRRVGAVTVRFLLFPRLVFPRPRPVQTISINYWCMTKGIYTDGCNWLTTCSIK